MNKDTDVVIVSAARTAIGTFGETLREVRAHKLAAHVIREVLKRANNLDPNVVSDVIVGDCLQNVDEANTARVAALCGNSAPGNCFHRSAELCLFHAGPHQRDTADSLSR
jgi:acetyl-CoA acetyltransferase